MHSTELARVLTAQRGAISRHQAAECGVGRRELDRYVARGLWRRLAHGVYATAWPLTWRGLAWAGLLVAGSSAVVSSRSALHLHGLCDEPAGAILIDVPRPVRVQPQPWWVFRRREQRGRGEPPRAGIEVALLDTWSDVSDEEFLALVGRAVSGRRTTAGRLRAELASRARVPRRRDLAALLGDAAEGAMSPLERRYLRDVERAHGLPTGRRQTQGPGGTWRDVAYEAWGVVVELDGRLGHEGVGRFRDMARDNANLLRGCATLRFGWSDVTGDPCAVAQQVAAVLQLAGWRGRASACRRCRRSAA